MPALCGRAGSPRPLYGRYWLGGDGVFCLHREAILSRVILHAPKNDDAVAGRLDLVAVDPGLMHETQASNLAFDQPLGSLLQRALRFENAHRRRAAFRLARFD